MNKTLDVRRSNNELTLIGDPSDITESSNASERSNGLSTDKLDRSNNLLESTDDPLNGMIEESTAMPKKADDRDATNNVFKTGTDFNELEKSKMESNENIGIITITFFE